MPEASVGRWRTFFVPDMKEAMNPTQGEVTASGRTRLGGRKDMTASREWRYLIDPCAKRYSGHQPGRLPGLTSGSPSLQSGHSFSSKSGKLSFQRETRSHPSHTPSARLSMIDPEETQSAPPSVSIRAVSPEDLPVVTTSSTRAYLPDGGSV